MDLAGSTLGAISFGGPGNDPTADATSEAEGSVRVAELTVASTTFAGKGDTFSPRVLAVIANMVGDEVVTSNKSLTSKVNIFIL
jgi:hypothetical protein